MNAFFDQAFCTALSIVLGHFLWQGALLACIAFVAAKAFRTSLARYRVFVAAFCLMAISPLVTVVTRSQLAELRAVAEKAPPRAAPGPPELAGTSPVNNSSTIPLVVPASDSADIHKLPSNHQRLYLPPRARSAHGVGWERFAPTMINVYLLGVAGMLLRLVVGLWGGWRLRQCAIRVKESDLLRALRRQAASLGLKVIPLLAYCERVAVPTVIGIFKPTILLPLYFASGLDAQQVEAILAHELAHLRRFDHLVNLLQRVVESALFFHPAVWWLSHRIRVEREHCCDDMVVACGAVPLDYAKSLLRVAELSRMSRRNRSVSAVSLLATGQPSTLRQRIARLLGDATDNHVRFLHRWPALLLATVCLLVAWTTTRVGWSIDPQHVDASVPYVAELPNGMKVELLSIGYHQTTSKTWWAADGTVLQKEPHDPALKRVEFNSFNAGMRQGETREVAVRITGIPKQETFFGYQFCFEPYGDAVSNCVVYEPSEFTTAAIPLVSQIKNKIISLRVCVDALPEEIVRTIGVDGKKLGGDPTTDVLRQVDSLVQPVRVEKLKEQTELILKPVNRGASPPVNEWVPVAIDKVGGRHESIRAGGREGFVSYIYPVPFDNLARFEYRLKPYRHWVTFSNISLEPGKKTGVSVKVESLAAPSISESKPVDAAGPVKIAPTRFLMDVAFGADRFVDGSVKPGILVLYEPYEVVPEAQIQTYLERKRDRLLAKHLAQFGGDKEAIVKQGVVLFAVADEGLTREQVLKVFEICRGLGFVSLAQNQMKFPGGKNTPPGLLLHVGYERNPDGVKKSDMPVLFYRGEVVPLSEFSPYLERARDEIRPKYGDETLRILKGCSVRLIADEDLSYTAVVDLLDRLKTVGFERISLAEGDSPELLESVKAVEGPPAADTSPASNPDQLDPELELQNNSPNATDVAAQDQPPEKQSATAAEPPKGLEFLAPYPKLKGLSLKMSEKQFLELAKKQDLDLSGREADGVYAIPTGDGHTVLVMFRGGECSGIQRIRGEETIWGQPNSGLRARIVPVAAAMNEDAIDMSQTVVKFTNPEDVAFAVEVENVSAQPIKLLDTRYGDAYGDSKGKANSNWYGQFLFSVDLYDAGGKRIERPAMQVVDLNSVLDGAFLATLQPGKTHRFLLRPAKWLSSMTQRLEPGKFKAVVQYHGLPKAVAERIKEYRPASTVLKAIEGDVVSAPMAFEVAVDAARQAAPPLVWGATIDGLRGAVELVPHHRTHIFGEKPEAKLHVQNVSEKPITLSSWLWLSDMNATVRDQQGKAIDVQTVFYSGWTLTGRVTLQPQQVVIFDAGNIGIAETKEQADKFEHVTHRKLVAPVGQYTLQLSGRFGDSPGLRDGKGKQLAPLDGDWKGELVTGETRLVVEHAKELEPKAKANAVAEPVVMGTVVHVDNKPVARVEIVVPEGRDLVDKKLNTNGKGGFNSAEKSLVQTITELCKQANIPLELDIEGHASVVYTKNIPTSFDLKSVAFEVAVKRVLQPFARLSFVIDKSGLYVSTRENVAQRQLFQQFAKSIVIVTTQREHSDGIVVNGMAVGMIVDTRGYVLVPSSILRKADPARTRIRLHNGVIIPSEILAIDTANDMAIMRISTTEILTKSILGKSAGLKIGDSVVAPSPNHSRKLGQVKELTWAKGAISGTQRDVEISDVATYKDLIEVGIKLFPGAGPILNRSGEVLGVAVVMRVGQHTVVFARPIDGIKPFLESSLPPTP